MQNHHRSRGHGLAIQRVEGGFPHSEILGSKLVRSSPRLIAAYHVLHRLSAPRHPPNALKTLDHSHDRCPRPPPSGARQRTIIRKTCLRISPETFACRTYPIEGAVTPSLVAETRSSALGYVPSSRFQTSACGTPRANCSKTPDKYEGYQLVEPDGIEPTTSCLQSRRSPN